MTSAIKGVTSSIKDIGVNIDHLNSKKLDIIANDKSVKDAKNKISEIETKLEHLKKQKASLSIKIDKNRVRELNSQIDKINSRINRLKDKEEIIKLKIKATTDESELKRLNGQLSRTRKKIIQLSGERLGIRDKLNKVKTENEKVNREIDKTSKEIKELNSQKVRLKKEFKEVQEEALKTNKTILGIEKAVQKINSLKMKIQQTVDRRENFKQNIVGNVAKVGAIAMPIKTGIEFESAMARVKAITMATDEQFKALEGRARELGSSTTFTSTQVAEGMPYLSMAGFKTEQTIKAMPGVLNLASAGAVDLATTSDIASNILSSFKLKAGQMGMVADVMAKTITSSNTSIETLGETMKYAATPAKTLGDSIQTVSGLAGKLGDIGIQGSMAGTALRSMYLRMASPPKEARKVIAKLGLQLKDSKGNFVGMLKILQQLHKKTQGLGNTVKSDYMKKLFGTEAVSAAIGLVDKADGTLEKYIESLKNAGGFAQKMADIQNNTTAGALKRLGSAIEGIAIRFSKIFIPAITEAGNKLASFSGWFGEMMEKYPKLTKAVVVGGTAFLAGSVALGALGIVAGVALNGIRTLRLGILATNLAMLASRGTTLVASLSFKNLGKVAMRSGLMMLKSPLFLAITAIALGALTIRKYWQPLKVFFSGVADGVSVALTDMKEKIGSVFEGIKERIAPLSDVFEPFINGVKRISSIVSEAFNNLLTPEALNTTDMLPNPALLSQTVQKMSQITDEGRKWGVWLGYTVAGVVALKGAILVTNAVVKVATLAMSGFTLAIRGVSVVSTMVAGGLRMLGGVVAMVGRALLLNPIGLAITAIATSAYLIYEYWEPIKSFFINLWSSVSSSFDSALGNISNSLNNIWGGIQSSLSSIWSELSSSISGAWSGIKSLLSWSPIATLSSAWQGAESIISSFISSIRNVSFGGIWENIKASLVSFSPMESIMSIWQPVGSFFGSIFSSISSRVVSAFATIRSSFSFNPLTIIAPLWNGVIAYFSNFNLYAAGQKIINSLIQGINSAIGRLKAKMHSVAQSVRNFFPFSPAKEGPLRDIHRIKLIETVAGSINHQPLTNAVRKATKQARKALSLSGAGLAIGATVANANPFTAHSVQDRTFQTQEKVQEQSISKYFSTKENLKLSEIPTLSDRNFLTKEIFKPATISSIQDRVFNTREKLYTQKIPTLNDRTFSTIEKLKLASISPAQDRTFQTQEIFKPASTSLPQPRVSTFQSQMNTLPKEDFSIQNSLTPKQSINQQQNSQLLQNNQISVSMGNIIVQGGRDGIAEPHIIQEQVRQLVEDGLRQATNSNRDRSFADMEGIGV